MAFAMETSRVGVVSGRGDRVGRPVDRRAGERQLLQPVRKVVLHRLERTDGHAELPSLLHVADGQIEHRLTETDELCGRAERGAVDDVGGRRGRRR